MGQWQQQPQQGHSQRANPQSTQTNTAGSFAGIPPVPPSNNFVPPTQQPENRSRDHQPPSYPNTIVDPHTQSTRVASGQTPPNQWGSHIVDGNTAMMGQPALALQSTQSSQSSAPHGPHRQWDGIHQPSLASSGNVAPVHGVQGPHHYGPGGPAQVQTTAGHMALAGAVPHTPNNIYNIPDRGNAGRDGGSVATVPQGFAHACRECRRPIPEDRMQIYGGHFCSKECRDAYSSTHSSHR